MFQKLAEATFIAVLASLLVFAPAIPARAENAVVQLTGDGVVKVKSVYDVGETIDRLKKDIAAKGIMFFMAVDQSKLAADAGIKLRPSTLLIFGNPPLGTQFITSNPNAGLDWPVRLLVSQDDQGAVWVIYTDFAWIADRHQIKDRGDQFKMATTVVQSITSSVEKK